MKSGIGMTAILQARVDAGWVGYRAVMGTDGTNGGALPNLVVIGAMKCGTTALHRYLDSHPQVGMAAQKEVDFFVGDGPAAVGAESAGDRTLGQWHRGWEWYASLFEPSKPVRGEASPGYTSPDQPQVAERMASRMPGVRLVLVVRDPLRRAVSQYHHHRRDGTEKRPLAEALLDTGSQYIARSRYHDRLRPYLAHFPAKQILVVVQERLLDDRRAELSRVYAHAGVDPSWWDDSLQERWRVGDGDTRVPNALHREFRRRVRDDTDRLRDLLGDDLPEWH
jgi:hypothetical protein